MSHVRNLTWFYLAEQDNNSMTMKYQEAKDAFVFYVKNQVLFNNTNDSKRQSFVGVTGLL